MEFEPGCADDAEPGEPVNLEGSCSSPEGIDITPKIYGNGISKWTLEQVENGNDIKLPGVAHPITIDSKYGFKAYLGVWDPSNFGEKLGAKYRPGPRDVCGTIAVVGPCEGGYAMKKATFSENFEIDIMTKIGILGAMLRVIEVYVRDDKKAIFANYRTPDMEHIITSTYFEYADDFCFANGTTLDWKVAFFGIGKKEILGVRGSVVGSADMFRKIAARVRDV